MELYEDRWKVVKEIIEKSNDFTLGNHYCAHMASSIKHFMICLSRYKFVAKLFKYRSDLSVFEVGCNEGLGGLMFLQETRLKRYCGVDIDADAIATAKKTVGKMKDSMFEFTCGDIMLENSKCDDEFDVAYCIDLIEHIPQSKEDELIENMIKNLKHDGTIVVGTPNDKMTPYASAGSRAAHINMYDHNRLYQLISKYFDNVFIFSMTDEVIHTGFEPMACYIFAIGSGKK